MAQYTSGIVFKGIDELSSVTRNIQLTVGALTESFKRNTNAMRDVNSEAKKLSNTFKKTRESTDRLGESSDNTKEKLSKLKSGLEGIRNLSKTAMIGITTPIVGMGGAMIKASADFERFLISFQMLTGDQSKGTKLFSTIKKMADETTFSIDDMAESARSMLAVDVGAGEVPEVLKLVGDVAAGANKPLSQIVGLYTKIRDGGRVTGIEMRQFRRAGIGMSAELAKVMGVPKNKVSELVKGGKIGFKEFEQALKNMTGEGGKFEDAMGKMADTLWGKWNVMFDNIKTTFATIGDDIAEIFDLRGVMSSVIDSSKKLRKWWTGLGDTTKKLIVVFLGVIAIIPPIIFFLTSLGITVITTKLAFRALGLSITGIGPAFLGAMKTMGAFGFMIFGIIEGGTALVENWEHVKGFFTDIWNDPLLAAETFLATMEDLFSGSAIANYLGDIFGFEAYDTNVVHDLFNRIKEKQRGLEAGSLSDIKNELSINRESPITPSGDRIELNVNLKDTQALADVEMKQTGNSDTRVNIEGGSQLIMSGIF